MSFSVHHPAELSEKNYYEFVIGKNAEAQLEDVYLAFFAIVLFILWGIVWTITRIYSIRGMIYTICIDIGIIIFINLLLIFIDYYVSLMVAFILFIVSISIIQKRFGKFYDSYIFIKKDGEQKSISFTPLMDKSVFQKMSFSSFIIVPNLYFLLCCTYFSLGLSGVKGLPPPS